MPEFGAWASRWWIPVLFVVIAGHLTNVCVTLFLHRAQTHRGVRLHAIAALPMRIWLWLTTAIVTKEWVACHRKHHAFADREGDPHSPLVEGLREILLKGAFYYRKAVRQPGMLEKYGKGTPNDWIERHLLTPLNWTGILVMLAIDIYLFGFFVGPAVWGVQMIWIPLWAAGVINGIGHALGYRNFEVKDESRNISPIAIWLGGEELHNNHHADPEERQVQGEVVRVRHRLGLHPHAPAVRPGQGRVRAQLRLRRAAPRRARGGRRRLTARPPMAAMNGSVIGCRKGTPAYAGVPFSLSFRLLVLPKDRQPRTDHPPFQV